MTSRPLALGFSTSAFAWRTSSTFLYFSSVGRTHSTCASALPSTRQQDDGSSYSHLGLVDGILERLVDEMGPETKVLATGGLGAMIGTASRFIKDVDEFLTLDGLRIIWDRNQTFRREAAAKEPKTQARPTQPLNSNAKPWPSPKSPKSR